LGVGVGSGLPGKDTGFLISKANPCFSDILSLRKVCCSSGHSEWHKHRALLNALGSLWWRLSLLAETEGRKDVVCLEFLL
jgi:hypothetical protein